MASVNLPSRRSFPLWMVHIMCALAAGFGLLTQESWDFRHLVPNSNVVAPGPPPIIFAALPALWPYALSLYYSRAIVPRQPLYLPIYATVLVAGTAAGIWFVTRSYGDFNPMAVAFMVSIPQAMVFGGVLSILRRLSDRLQLPSNNRWRGP